MHNLIITKEFLDTNPNTIFVFGDNLLREGMGGAARLRYHKQAYGFITKKAPTHFDHDYYTPDDYLPVYEKEVKKLIEEVSTSNNIFFISPIGSGLANKFLIFDRIIAPTFKNLFSSYKNVLFLW